MTRKDKNATGQWQAVARFRERQSGANRMESLMFDGLGLTAGEREAVYEAVVNLVRARLEKTRMI